MIIEISIKEFEKQFVPLGFNTGKSEPLSLIFYYNKLIMAYKGIRYPVPYINELPIEENEESELETVTIKNWKTLKKILKKFKKEELVKMKINKNQVTLIFDTLNIKLI